MLRGVGEVDEDAILPSCIWAPVSLVTTQDCGQEEHRRTGRLTVDEDGGGLCVAHPPPQSSPGDEKTF